MLQQNLQASQKNSMNREALLKNQVEVLKIFRSVLKAVYSLPERHIASECARQNSQLVSLVVSLLQQDLDA